MAIEDLPRQYCINQNRTLQEFAGNITDRSYYRGVEGDIHQISAGSLINLPRYNQIDTIELIETLNPNCENYQSQTQVQGKITEETYYQVDKDGLKKVRSIVIESKLSERDKEIQNLIANGLLELLNLDKPNQEIRDEIRKKIFEVPNLNNTKFMLYCSSIHFYDLIDSEAIVRGIIEKYQVREFTLVKESLLSLAIDILVLSVEENKFENIDFYTDFANKILTNPDLLFYKSAITFFTYFIQYKEGQDKSALQYYDAIIRNFYLVDMPECREDLRKFKGKYR